MNEAVIEAERYSKYQSNMRMQLLDQEIRKAIDLVNVQLNDRMFGHEIQQTLLAMALGYQQRVVEESLAISQEKVDLQNPYMPDAPEDGKHDFELEGSDFQGGVQTSYRCLACGVYNRPEDPEFNKPCKGNWANSGKIRSASRERFAREQLEKEKTNGNDVAGSAEGGEVS